MIRNEQAYHRAKKKLLEERAQLDSLVRALKEEGLGPEAIARTTGMMSGRVEELELGVARYEQAKRGEFGQVVNLEGLGALLVGARIALGITQSELARRLEVDPSQVSKDERFEYQGLTMERATRVLDALGAELVSELRLLEQEEEE